MPTRRAFLALVTPAVFYRQTVASQDADEEPIRDAAADLAELIRPRPKAFLHYHLNSFDIWVAATYLKYTIRKAGFPANWRRHYRIACAVAKDMTHAEWECYPGCRHWRAHEFAERIIDSGELARYDTEIVS